MKPLISASLAIQPSAALAIAGPARRMACQRHSVCNFSAGEPDIHTPAFIKDACIDALHK